MAVLRNLMSGIKALFHKEQRNREIDEELRGYIEAAAEEKMRRGVPREMAERAARIEAGSAAVVRHRVWSESWESAVESLGQDVRFGDSAASEVAGVFAGRDSFAGAWNRREHRDLYADQRSLAEVAARSQTGATGLVRKIYKRRHPWLNRTGRHRNIHL